jgi:cytochrome c2
MSPKDVLPKTIMPCAGLKVDAKRANLIAHLGTLR